MKNLTKCEKITERESCSKFCFDGKINQLTNCPHVVGFITNTFCLMDLFCLRKKFLAQVSYTRICTHFLA